MAKTNQTTRRFAMDDANIRLSPYTWHLSVDHELCAEAGMPGAYLRMRFRHSESLGVCIVDRSPLEWSDTMSPVIEFSIDNGPFSALRTKKTGGLGLLSLANGLAKDSIHSLELYFRSAPLDNRWESRAGRLILAGIELDATATILPCQSRPKHAVVFGDSITEGVYSESGIHGFYQDLMENNARIAWAPLVCLALDCEYGQLGSGGLGLAKPMSLPPLSQSWDKFNHLDSRLENGLLTPPPDYVFCCIGTNDFEVVDGMKKHSDISKEYEAWLSALRKACPDAHVFCITPPLGWHRGEIAGAVEHFENVGDTKIHLIDTSLLSSGYDCADGTKASKFASDGCHPTAYGNAVLAAFISAKAQSFLR